MGLAVNCLMPQPSSHACFLSSPSCTSSAQAPPSLLPTLFCVLQLPVIHNSSLIFSSSVITEGLLSYSLFLSHFFSLKAIPQHVLSVYFNGVSGGVSDVEKLFGMHTTGVGEKG